MSQSSSRHTQKPAAPLRYNTRPRPPQEYATRQPRTGVSYIRQRRIPLLFGSVVGAGLAWYCVSVYRGYSRDVELSASLDVPEDVSDRYKYTAIRFDKDVSSLEWLTGIDKRRRQLCAKAKGHVLEVSAGTGRNSKYLPLLKGVKSVTLVDKNREMIDEARYKWPDEGNAWFIRTAFRVQDCKEKVPCPQPEGFDTVIQTMGICSTGEPEKLLKNMGEMTNPDGGQILLLEHGKGYYSWLNTFLDKTAPAHADRHGCWYNKDIGAIVEKSGLEIVEQKRFNFGTTWWFVLKPRRPISRYTSDSPLNEERTSWFSWLGLKVG